MTDTDRNREILLSQKSHKKERKRERKEKKRKRAAEAIAAGDANHSVMHAVVTEEVVNNEGRPNRHVRFEYITLCEDEGTAAKHVNSSKSAQISASSRNLPITEKMTCKSKEGVLDTQLIEQQNADESAGSGEEDMGPSEEFGKEPKEAVRTESPEGQNESRRYKDPTNIDAPVEDREKHWVPNIDDTSSSDDDDDAAEAKHTAVAHG